MIAQRSVSRLPTRPRKHSINARNTFLSLPTFYLDIELLRSQVDEQDAGVAMPMIGAGKGDWARCMRALFLYFRDFSVSDDQQKSPPPNLDPCTWPFLVPQPLISQSIPGNDPAGTEGKGYADHATSASSRRASSGHGSGEAEIESRG